MGQGIQILPQISDGVDTTVYSVDSRLRAGTDSIEVQAASAVFNEMKAHASDDTDTADGRGDTSFAVKVALPSHQRLSGRRSAR